VKETDMKRFYWAVAAVLCAAGLALAQAAARPDPAKELFAREAGTWDCEVKMYMRGPDAPPREHKGVEVNQVVSGKYLQTKFTYMMGNREYEGHGLMGFDARSKKYVGTWVDNFTSAPDQFKADYDEKAKTLTIRSGALDGGGSEMKTKKITTWIDDSKKTMVIYMIAEEGGKETDIKLMQIDSTKRKG
jgi:hypothetical protein